MALNPDPASMGGPGVNQPADMPVGDTPMRQLDFYQAMNDFKQMFPTLDEEVIEAVLRANNGAVDATIDQLLTMTVDQGDTDSLDGSESEQFEAFGGQLGASCSPDHAPHCPPLPAQYSPQKTSQSLTPGGLGFNQHFPNEMKSGVASDSSSSDDEFDPPPSYPPPSYNDYANLPSYTAATSSPSSTASPQHLSSTDATPCVDEFNMFSSPKKSPEHLNRSADIAGWSLDSAEIETHPKRTMGLEDDLISASAMTPPVDDSLGASAMPPMMNLLDHSYTVKETRHTASPPTSMRLYHNWDPPLLGTLPRDFLRIRLTPEQYSEHHVISNPVHSPPTRVQRSQSARSTTAPLSSHHHHHPHHHPHHHHHHRMERSASAASATTYRPERPVARPERSHRVERSTSTSKHSPSHSPAVPEQKRPQRSHSLTAQHGKDELNSSVIQQKIVENERKRSQVGLAGTDVNPKTVQMLEDERLALALQNTEFVALLQQDEEFMRMLERDRMNATAFESDEPMLDPSRPPSDQIEGYGEDHQDHLDAFPFSQPMPRDENAEFHRQLKHMGGTSKKKMMTLARKFFTRKKKKSSKQILKDTMAPSTVNLLEEDDYADLTNHSHDDGDSMGAAVQLNRVPNIATVGGYETNRPRQNIA